MGSRVLDVTSFLLWLTAAFVCDLRSGVKFGPVAVHAAPVKISFEGCGTFSCPQCCPRTKKGRDIVNFRIPEFNSSKPLRVRKALQCADEEYARKLRRGYELMRALPSEDPRSFESQWRLHCAYSMLSFVQDCAPVDVHYGWLFLPFHRLFLYFHERILQGLLGDPQFSIYFWHWDFDGSSSVPSPRRRGGCFKAGNKFPTLYLDPSTSLYDGNRSDVTVDCKVVDLGFIDPAKNRSVVATEGLLLARNNEIMTKAVVTGAKSARRYFGRELRAGDAAPRHRYGDGGSLEVTAHVALHAWIGRDMRQAQFAARDPVFYPHHANLDRLWELWLGLGAQRKNPTDPDWLNAEFLFSDENAQLTRVKVSDSLDIRKLGYSYDHVPKASWLP